MARRVAGSTGLPGACTFCKWMLCAALVGVPARAAHTAWRSGEGALPGVLSSLSTGLERSERELRREEQAPAGLHWEALLRALRTRDDRVFALLGQHLDRPEVRRLALATALLHKGRSADEEASSRAAVRGPGPEAPPSLPLPGDVVEAVCRALPPDGALVELVAYEERPLADGEARGREGRPGGARYVALVLFPDCSSAAAILGPAFAVEAGVARFDRAMSSSGTRYLDACQRLYALAVQPWATLAGRARRLFLAPDGALSKVSFGALHDGRRFFTDAHEIDYLTSGRDLLPRPERARPGRGVVVFADPDLGDREGGGAGVRGGRPGARCVDPSRSSWSPLPGARREAAAVKRFFPDAQVKLGAEATAAALFEMNAPGVLHIATHGVSEEPLGPEPPGARAPIGIDALAAPVIECPADPLRRSGLIFAGSSPPGRPGGPVVTAAELMGLDLRGTELVVLSACGSGLGEVERNQGVYGLRRAFLVAGAQTLVTSLWAIDDETTATLMEEYYRHLGEGHGRAAALREAMRAVRARQAHPHFWAPFIAIGKGGPLRKTSAPEAGSGVLHE